jgi:hypothetical protein
MSLQHAPRRNFRPIIRCSPWVAALAVSLATYPPARAVPATGPATEPSANPTTQPGTQPAPDEAKPRHRPAPESFLRSQRQQRDMSRNMFSNIRQGATYRLDALLQFRMVKGIMDIQTAAVPVGEQTRIKVEGSNAVWIGFRQPQNFNVAFPGAPLAVTTTASTITRVDPDVKADDEVWSTYINVSGDNFWIMGQSVCGRVNINQSNGQIGVNVMEWTSGPGGNIQTDSLLNTRASSIGQLRAEHPEEFRKYVLPLLSKLSDMQWLQPGTSDVYVMFPQIPADEQVMRKIRALLPDLDSDAFPVRDTASTQLAALGPPGVLAALRMDWSELSDEQRSRLLALVNDNHRREMPDVAAARKDLNLLADCLEYDDPAVRAAAKAAIEQALGQPVSFDVQSSGDARTDAVDAVRKQIAQAPAPSPQTQPSTRPAADVGPAAFFGLLNAGNQGPIAKPQAASGSL